MKQYLEKLGDAFRQNKIYYLLVLLFFCIGIVIGVYTVMYMNNADKTDITSYFSTFVKSLNSKTTDYNTLLINILKKNLILIIPIVLLAFTFFGSPIILIIDLIKGFSLGYTFTFILCSYNGRGLGLALASVFPQNIVYVPCIIILSVLGLNLSTGIFKQKVFKNVMIKKLEYLRRVSSYIVLIVGLFLFGMFIETYISPNIIKLVVTKFYM